MTNPIEIVKQIEATNDPRELARLNRLLNKICRKLDRQHLKG